MPTFPQQAFSCFPTNPRDGNSSSVVRVKEQVVPVKDKQTHALYRKCNVSGGAEMCNTASFTVTFCPLGSLNRGSKWLLCKETNTTTVRHRSQPPLHLNICSHDHSCCLTGLTSHTQTSKQTQGCRSVSAFFFWLS